MTTPAPGTAAPAVEAAPTTTPVEAPTAPAAPAVPAPVPVAPAPEAPVADPQGKVPDLDGPLDEERAKTMMANARAREARADEKRIAAEKALKDLADQQQASQAEMLKKLAAALGLPGSEEAQPPTVEELTKQLTDSRAETEKAASLARQRDVELAVYRTATAAGGDADALLDSRSFLRSIRDLDPTASTFAADVSEAVKAAVEGNSKLAAKQPEVAPTPARGGADLSGAAGGKRQLTKADVDRMTPEQIVKAREAGQLKDYMSGPG